MIRACPHHEYGKNNLNTFFCDGFNDCTKAVLDSAVGRQLSKVLCNQVKAKIEEVAKNSSWGGARSGGLRDLSKGKNDLCLGPTKKVDKFCLYMHRT